MLSIEPGLPVLLAGIRDELTDRAWEPPGWHWPEYDALVGGLDPLVEGQPRSRASDGLVACVLNGVALSAGVSASRGVLPLEAARASPLTRGRWPTTCSSLHDHPVRSRGHASWDGLIAGAAASLHLC